MKHHLLSCLLGLSSILLMACADKDSSCGRLQAVLRLTRANILFILLFIVTYGYAQTNHYTHTCLYKLKDCNYQCKVDDSGMVTLYNAANRLDDDSMVYRDTGEEFNVPENDDKVVIEFKTAQEYIKCKLIVKKIFDKYKGKLCADEFLLTSLYLDSQTGRVLEVVFEFHRRESFGIIPVEDFREIELQLKEQIQMRVTEEGRKLNCILFWWDQYPS